MIIEISPTLLVEMNVESTDMSMKENRESETSAKKRSHESTDEEAGEQGTLQQFSQGKWPRRKGPRWKMYRQKINK